MTLIIIGAYNYGFANMWTNYRANSQWSQNGILTWWYLKVFVSLCHGATSQEQVH